MNFVTIVLSMILVKTDVINVGRKSTHSLGEITFGTGWIQAVFSLRWRNGHCK
jgi:hypothetical protein